MPRLGYQPVLQGNCLVSLAPHLLRLPLLLQLPVELRKTLAISRLEGVLVAEVEVEAEPLLEMGR